MSDQFLVGAIAAVMGMVFGPITVLTIGYAVLWVVEAQLQDWGCA